MGEKKSKHHKDKKRKKSASDSEPGAWMMAVAHMRRCRTIRCHLMCKAWTELSSFVCTESDDHRGKHKHKKNKYNKDKDKKKDAAATSEEKRLVKEAKRFLKQRECRKYLTRNSLASLAPLVWDLKCDSQTCATALQQETSKCPRRHDVQTCSAHSCAV